MGSFFVGFCRFACIGGSLDSKVGATDSICVFFDSIWIISDSKGVCLDSKWNQLKNNPLLQLKSYLLQQF